MFYYVSEQLALNSAAKEWSISFYKQLVTFTATNTGSNIAKALEGINFLRLACATDHTLNLAVQNIPSFLAICKM